MNNTVTLNRIPIQSTVDYGERSTKSGQKVHLTNTWKLTSHAEFVAQSQEKFSLFADRQLPKATEDRQSVDSWVKMDKCDTFRLNQYDKGQKSQPFNSPSIGKAGLEHTPDSLITQGGNSMGHSSVNYSIHGSHGNSLIRRSHADNLILGSHEDNLKRGSHEDNLILGSHEDNLKRGSHEDNLIPGGHEVNSTHQRHGSNYIRLPLLGPGKTSLVTSEIGVRRIPHPVAMAEDVQMDESRGSLSVGNNQEKSEENDPHVQKVALGQDSLRQPLNPLQNYPSGIPFEQTRVITESVSKRSVWPVRETPLSNMKGSAIMEPGVQQDVYENYNKESNDPLLQRENAETNAIFKYLTSSDCENSQVFMYNNWPSTDFGSVSEEPGESKQGILLAAFTAEGTDNENVHVCNKCWKTFDDAGTLSRHMETHRENRVYRCKICNQEFSTLSGLGLHLRTHTVGKNSNKVDATLPDKKLLHCPLCVKTFRSSTGLGRHMYIHTGKRPYGCPICKKRFIQSSDVKKHLPIHKNQHVKPNQWETVLPPMFEHANYGQTSLQTHHPLQGGVNRSENMGQRTLPPVTHTYVLTDPRPMPDLQNPVMNNHNRSNKNKEGLNLNSRGFNARKEDSQMLFNGEENASGTTVQQNWSGPVMPDCNHNRSNKNNEGLDLNGIGFNARKEDSQMLNNCEKNVSGTTVQQKWGGPLMPDCNHNRSNKHSEGLGLNSRGFNARKEDSQMLNNGEKNVSGTTIQQNWGGPVMPDCFIVPDCDQRVMQDAYVETTASRPHVGPIHPYQGRYNDLVQLPQREDLMQVSQTEVQNVESSSNHFVCHICNERFADSPTLLVHMDTHQRKNPAKMYQCERCGKLCKSLAGFQRHVKAHTLNRYPCEFCESVYLSPWGIRKHVMLSHSNKKRDDHSIYVQHLMRMANLLDQHLTPDPKQSPKKRGISKFVGSDHNVGFTRKTDLDGHEVALHGGRSAYAQCIECVGGFTRKEDLQRHLAMHRRQPEQEIRCRISV